MKAKLPKYLLIVLNFAVFLCGGIIFIAGLLLKLESGFLEGEVKTLFNNVTYNGIRMGILADALSYMMMVFGGLVMVAAILGGCGAWNKIRICLLVYVLFLILMIVAQGVMIGFWVSARGRANEWLKGRMLDLLKSYEGPTKTDTISKGWNTLFMTAECCGVNAQYANGGTNNDFSELSVPWWTTDKQAAENIPATCCQGVTSSIVSEYVDSDTCTREPQNFYTAGCYDKVKEYIYTYSLIMIITVGIIFAVEVTAIISACLVMTAINKIRHV